MKTGFVGLVGLTNAGKSTLVNQLLGEKVGIVTKKAQTTRRRILGIFNDEDSQIVFVDAPGKVNDSKGLNGYLKDELAAVIEDSDALIAVLNIDAKNPNELESIIEMTARSGKPWVAVITKDDIPKPHRTMKLREMVKEAGGKAVAISALKRSDELLDLVLPLVKETLPETEHPLYPRDIYTTETERELVEEVVREKCFELLHEEIPYGLATKCIEYNESDKITHCLVDIVVSKKSHMSIVVGKGGQNLKKIGMNSRLDCEKRLGRKLMLKTYVKCVEDWPKRQSSLKEYGYAERT